VTRLICVSKLDDLFGIASVTAFGGEQAAKLMRAVRAQTGRPRWRLDHATVAVDAQIYSCPLK
jgi:hypothetical protein